MSNRLKTHIATADILSAALRDNFGMNPVRENIAFDDFKSIVEFAPRFSALHTVYK